MRLCLDGGLGEVRAHVLLEVEIGQAILAGQLQKLGKLGIGENVATVGLILQIIRLDVSVNLLRHLGARHLGSNGLLQEHGQLVADQGGLDKARRFSVSVLALILRISLQRHLQLLGLLLLNHAVIGLE